MDQTPNTVCCERCGRRLEQAGPLAGVCPVCLLDESRADVDDSTLGLDDRYTILNVLGEDNAGRLFLARSEARGQPVAIKVLRATKDRSLRAAQLEDVIRRLTNVDHPGVARLFEVGALPSQCERPPGFAGEARRV